MNSRKEFFITVPIIPRWKPFIKNYPNYTHGDFLYNVSIKFHFVPCIQRLRDSYYLNVLNIKRNLNNSYNLHGRESYLHILLLLHQTLLSFLWVNNYTFSKIHLQCQPFCFLTCHSSSHHKNLYESLL